MVAHFASHELIDCCRKGRDCRIQLPTLADYVTMTPRRVTPVRFDPLGEDELGLIVKN